jgi:hypothetical protein
LLFDLKNCYNAKTTPKIGFLMKELGFMMTNQRGYCRFLFVLICLFPISVFAGVCPSSDLTEDCRVDLLDLGIFVDQWLNTEMCDEGGHCADFLSPEGIDFIDFSVLMNDWLLHGTQLVINEFMASNTSASGIHDPFGDYDDWIEIHNFGDTAIDLAGMFLTDDLAVPTKWQIPSGFSSQTTIDANGYLVFWADDETVEGPLHTNYKLSGSGEEIGLFDTDGVTPIDTIGFAEQTTNIAYGRDPNIIDNWRFFPSPTPGAINNTAYLGEVDQLQLSHKRGFYTSSSSFNLTIACVTPGANIYYTTDGRSPIAGEVNTPTSIRYTTPITLNSTKFVRAAAIKTGWMPTRTETHTYVFDANSYHKAIPVMAIVGDPTESLWEPNGVMSVNHRSFGYEKPASLEILDVNNAGNDYQIDCGLRIHGNARGSYTIGNDWLTCWVNWWDGWNSNKFAFRFYFRSIYGNNRFDYPFFTFTPEVTREQCIVLRAGKNDSCTPLVKDEFWRRLYKQMGGAQLTGRCVNLYINGVYKAYFNPTGRDNAQFYQEYYGTNNEIDVISNAGLRDGDTVAWDAMLYDIDTLDFSDNANYEYISGKIDIDDFIDYLIVQIHSGNFDWPNNNWAANRERSENSKWRFSIWDAEGTEQWYFGADCAKCADTAFDKFPSYLTPPMGLNAGDWPICRIYRALKTNPNFRQLFADRIHRHYKNNGIMSTARILTTWNDTVNEIKPVLPAYDGVLPPSFVGTVFLPKREPYVLTAFQTNGLYNLALGAPVFNVNGSYKFGGYVSTSDTFTMTDPCSSGGTIYYTTDGSDPRLPAIGNPPAQPPPVEVNFVVEDANKKVLIPISSTGTTWRGGNEPYNDAAWTAGHGGVGYERSTGYGPYIDINVGPVMYNINATCYIRIPFTIDACDANNITSLTLRMMFDDGFVAYINGTEVKRVNSPSSPTWNSVASSEPTDTNSFVNYDISSYISALHSGNNILAIHGMNRATNNNDFLIASELKAMVNRIVPVEPNLTPGAIQYAGSFTINKSTNLRARIFKNTGEWSPLNEAVYTLANVGQNLRITEIMYNLANTGQPNDEDSEYIELKNVGASAINLNLTRLTKGVDFTFGPNTLAAGQYILVVKDINAFTTKYGAGRPIAGQYDGSLNNAGENIRLKDANGTNILDFDFKDGWRSNTDGDGYSLTIINPADSNVNHWGNKDYWRSSAYINGSPGWDDSGIIPNPGSIVINEVLAHSHAEASDWIELRNTTTYSIDIGGWYLSDSDSNLMKYRFSTGTTIPANGYLAVYESNNFGPNSVDPNKLIGFALSENGDMVCLTSALDSNGFLTGYREKEEFGASETGVSFGRYYKASTNSYNFVSMDANTPGYANSYPDVGPIVITEIMYDPNWPAGGNYANDEYEYIELRNTSGSAVTLYDYAENEPWAFTNGIDYTFPSPPDAVTIAAGARIIVAKNPTAFNWRYPGLSSITYGPYTGWLANDGEQLELSKPGDVDELDIRQYIRVERVDYSDGSHPNGEPGDVDLWPAGANGLGKSLKRTNDSLYGNDPNNWTAATPTPGS